MLLRILLTLILVSPAMAQERVFGGNECTGDCSGHKAGYEWAQQTGVIDESVCSGNSASFVEGCQTYVKEPDRGADEDDSGDPIE